MFYLHNFVSEKTFIYRNILLQYPYSFHSRKNSTSHLRKGLCGPVNKQHKQKKLTERKCACVQGQNLYNAAQRKIRLPLFLTRLSEEETQGRGLCIFQTYTLN